MNQAGIVRLRKLSRLTDVQIGASVSSNASLKLDNYTNLSEAPNGINKAHMLLHLSVITSLSPFRINPFAYK